MNACLRYVSHEHLTNASVRQRFGIDPKNIATASRLIREAGEAGVIVPYDPAAAPKLMRYVPVCRPSPAQRYLMGTRAWTGAKEVRDNGINRLGYLLGT